MGRREAEYRRFLERTGYEDNETVWHDFLDETNPDGSRIESDDDGGDDFDDDDGGGRDDDEL